MSDLEQFKYWFGWYGVNTYFKNGHEYIEYASTERKDFGKIRCTIDGEEVFEFTRKSQCCGASTIDIGNQTQGEVIACDSCKKRCLTYLDRI